MSNKLRNKTAQPTVYSFYHVDDMVHEQWPNLTAAESRYCKTDFNKFCEAVQREYGISKEEIERCLELMRREMLYAA